MHNTCYIIGNPHGVASHQLAIYDEAMAMVASGNYSYVYMNIALSTAGLNGSYRPDTIGIGANGNTNRIVEVMSPGQDGGRGLSQLMLKLKQMGISNPGAQVDLLDRDRKKQ